MNKFRNSLIGWMHQSSAPEAVLRGAYPRYNGCMLILFFETYHEISLMDTRDGEVWVRLGSETWAWRDSGHHIGSWSVSYEHN